MLISFASPVEGSGLTTLAWNTASAVSTRLKGSSSPKRSLAPSAYQYSKVCFLEADPAGGMVGSVLSVPVSSRYGLMETILRPEESFQRLPELMWQPQRRNAETFGALLSTDGEPVGSALKQGEKNLAAHFSKGRGDTIAIADAGRCLTLKRGILDQASILVWLLETGNPSAMLRTRNIFRDIEDGLTTNRTRIVCVTTGDSVEYYEEVIEELTGSSVHIGHLPKPSWGLQDAPPKKYQESIESISAALLEAAAKGGVIMGQKPPARKKANPQSAKKSRSEKTKAAKKAPSLKSLMSRLSSKKPKRHDGV